MKESIDEDRESGLLGVIPSGYGSREDLMGGFRQVKRLLFGLLAAVIATMGLVILLSGERETIVSLSSDGHMQTLSRLPDGVYEKNFSRIVRFFLTDFLGNLTAYDSLEISYRLERALSVMNPDLRERMKREIVAQNLIDGVRKAHIHTVLSLKKISLHRVSSGVWSVDTEGVRTTYPYGEGLPKVQGFSARILLRKGAPTVFDPYGLWVSGFQERPVRSQTETSP